MLRTLSEAKHNVQGMENIVFSGSLAACARVEVVGEPTQAVLSAIAESPDVFHVGSSAI